QIAAALTIRKGGQEGVASRCQRIQCHTCAYFIGLHKRERGSVALERASVQGVRCVQIGITLCTQREVRAQEFVYLTRPVHQRKFYTLTLASREAFLPAVHGARAPPLYLDHRYA